MTIQPGNILTRLQGLKNITGNPARRRVMQDPLDNPMIGPQEQMDVSGTAQNLPMNQNFALSPEPAKNMPQQERGGELTAQSYDVRNNTSQREAPQEGGFFRRLGQSLASAFSKPSLEEDNMFLSPEKPVSSQEPPLGKTVSNAFQAGLGRGLEMPAALSQEGSLTPIIKERNAQMPAPSPVFQPAEFLSSMMNKPEPQAREVSKQLLTQQIDQAMQNPMQFSAYGATEELAKSPALQAEFQRITGMNFEPQVQEAVRRMETVMNAIENNMQGYINQLDPISQEIAERIRTNQTTDQDNYLIGLALLMPLIVGGFFGAEAGVGTLAGSSAGLAQALGNKQKGLRADEALLSDINRQQMQNQEKLGNLQIQRSMLEPKIRESLPADPRSHLVGLEEAKWVDPVSGKEVSGVKLRPGLVAPSEKVATPAGLKRAEDEAEKLAEQKTHVDRINDIAKNIIDITSQLKDSNFAWKAARAALSSGDTSMIEQVGDTVILNGRRVNAAVALQQQLALLMESHAREEKLGQLDKAAQEHSKKLISNPQTSLLSPQESINQILELQRVTQNNYLNNVYNHGFYRDFALKEMDKQTRPMFDKFNAKANDKKSEDLVKRASKNDEVKYAK